jgi:hypothetical protein
LRGGERESAGADCRVKEGEKERSAREKSNVELAATRLSLVFPLSLFLSLFLSLSLSLSLSLFLSL